MPKLTRVKEAAQDLMSNGWPKKGCGASSGARGKNARRP
jgi:hypothetical protein